MKKHRTRSTKKPPPLPPPDVAYIRQRIGAALQPKAPAPADGPAVFVGEIRRGRNGRAVYFTVDTPKIEPLPDGRYVVDAATLAALMGVSGEELYRRHGKDIHHGRRFRVGGRNKGTTKYLTPSEQVSLVNEWRAEQAQNSRWTLPQHVTRHLDEHGVTLSHPELLGLLDTLYHVSSRLRRGKSVI